MTKEYELTDGTTTTLEEVAKTAGITESAARSRLDKSRNREKVMRPRVSKSENARKMQNSIHLPNSRGRRLYD